MKSKPARAIKKSITLDAALKKMERFCAYRERSSSEVIQKLKQFDMPTVARSQICQALQAENFLDDERFAQTFAQGKFRMNDWGKVRIRYELQRRGISEKLIERALSVIPDEDYQQTLKQKAQKKWDSLPRKTDRRQKIWMVVGYLSNCGFEQPLIFEVLEQIVLV